MDSYVITEVGEGDADLLASLIREAFATVATELGLTPENAPRHPSNCTPEWVRAAFAKGIRHFVLETPNGPAGCVALEQADSEVCYVERLAVLPAHRRSGFGEALVDYAVGRARECGARRVELGMVAAQTGLREWYEKLGFSLTSIVQFEGAPFEVAFMRKYLEGGDG
ncbi:MAG: GNAT family N-acetyltransferase [Dehalococcoidia bacterium]|nr:GNAT family N-acetyltransferase [Dehalococcoidia bacterium]